MTEISSCSIGLVCGQPVHNCSSVDVLEQTFTQIDCNPQVQQPILDIYQQCGLAEYELLIAQCGLSETNQFCRLLIANETHPRAVESQCQNYSEGCTPSCYVALNSFKTAFGCCVNFYNNSIYGNYRNTTNPDLWSACGIPTPGFCPSTHNSALRWDFPNITWTLVVLVVLNLQM